jgi:uncharacterized protein (TIGR03435 family)
VPFTTLTVNGETIAATLTADGRTIRLDATVDGDTIAGRWSIDGDDDRWTFEGTRQAPAGARVPVTIRRSSVAASGPGSIRVRPDGEFAATGVTLRELIAYAYQRHPFDTREIEGGPGWMDIDRFDVVAALPGELAVAPDGSIHETWSLVREWLAERFALDVSEQEQTRPIYALRLVTAGAPGPQLRTSDVDCGVAMKRPRPLVGPNGPPCGMKTPPGRLFANTITMPTLASLLSRYVDRPVVDRTRLTGRFDVVLEAAGITPPPNYVPGPSDLALPAASGPPMATAVREQLGLMLQAETGSIPVVIVDHAARPDAP